MIKKLLFVTAILSVGYCSAQSFQLLDHLDNNIGGTNHTEYGNGDQLGETKFHVKNMTGNTISYTCEVQEITNVPNTDLQVCYGTNCFSATAGVPTVQSNIGNSTVSGGAIDTTLKVAPFSGFGAWTGGETATWRVKIYNTTNVNDSASVVVTWQNYGVGIEEISANKVSLSAYPNPTIDKLTINYVIDGKTSNATIDVFDVVGKRVKSYPVASNKNKLNISVSDLNSGVYFYSIMVDNKAMKTERVIIK